MVLKNDIAILCGGRGTRVSHIYPDLPKVLFPIDEGIPLLDALLSSLFLQGFKRFILCIGHLGEKIEEYCEDYPLKNLIVFSYEPEILMGTAGALRLAKEYIKSDPFFVINGDSYSEVELKDLINYQKEKEAVAVIGIVKPEGRKDAGNIQVDTDFRILSFEEKEGKSKYINAGIYLFKKSIFDFIPENKNYSLEEDVFPKLISSKRVYGFPIMEEVVDIGTEERYKQYISLKIL